MKVIRKRSEEISVTSFWRQEREDHLFREAIYGLHRISAKFHGKNLVPFNLLPIKSSSWKCKMNAALGAMFTLFYLENRMDAFCSPDILAVWTAF